MIYSPMCVGRVGFTLKFPPRVPSINVSTTDNAYKHVSYSRCLPLVSIGTMQMPTNAAKISAADR